MGADEDFAGIACAAGEESREDATEESREDICPDKDARLWGCALGTTDKKESGTCAMD